MSMENNFFTSLDEAQDYFENGGDLEVETFVCSKNDGGNKHFLIYLKDKESSFVFRLHMFESCCY